MPTKDEFIPESPLTTNVSVAKSNDLINAVYRLSLIEAQLLHFCIAWSREHQLGLSTEKPLRLRVTDFQERFNLGKGTAYQQTKEALEALYQRDITLYEKDDKTGKRETVRTRWMSQYSYIDGAGIITVIFTPKVIQHITRLEKAFTSYNMIEIAGFSSYYAVRLYELLMQFKDKGWRTISIDDLREAFGTAPTQYKLVAQFKRNTVDVAVAQINELTPWKVTYQNHKYGVKITGLTFNIKRKPVKEPKKIPTEVMDDAYITRHARPGESWQDARKRLQAAWDSGTNYDKQNDMFT